MSENPDLGHPARGCHSLATGDAGPAFPVKLWGFVWTQPCRIKWLLEFLAVLALLARIAAMK
jgi:hypothetical protein